jgi:hypothetical protein
MRKGRETPEQIETLADNEIFVFGSNIMGRHGKGAAKQAKEKFGAVSGIGRWMTGRCFAIPTKDYRMQPLTPNEIGQDVDFLIEFAKRKPELTFLVTEIGCGLAGHAPHEIAPLFAGAMDVPNIFLPARFWDELEDRVKLG